MKLSLHLSSAFCTHPGMVRSHNEDACLADDENACFLVADGMGGAVAGEVASRIMKEAVRDLFAARNISSLEELEKLVSCCFQAANDRVLARVRAEPSYSGMGCTAVLLAIFNNTFILGHVGDSRCYRLRDGSLKQLTYDHTLVQAQIDQGLINREQAKTHKMKNFILRAVGIDKELEVECSTGNLLPGDIFLLCSDGLTDMVGDADILEILNYNGDSSTKAAMLVDQANHSGGKDNISAVLVIVE